MAETREPDRYEEKAREVFRSLVMDEARAVPVLAAALRAATAEALERAAQVCDEEHNEYWRASRAFDAAGNHFSGAAEAHGACASKRIGERIRALKDPAAAPAAEMGPARYVVPAPRLADAEKRSAELEAALRTVEWMLPPQGESPAYCLSCGGAQPHHAPGCRINAVLSRAAPQSGEGK